MRTRQEIIDYLGLWMGEAEVGKEGIADNEKYIKAAEKIEKNFATELAEGIYGYGLHCDFINTPDVLEDYGDHPILTEVANYDGVVVYKKKLGVFYMTNFVETEEEVLNYNLQFEDPRYIYEE